MKKIILIIIYALLPTISFAQTDNTKKLTKFEEFSSRTGEIIKFTNYNLPRLPLTYGNLETCICVLKEGSNKYFYRLEKPETSSSIAWIAAIEYSDIVEINKALAKLVSEVEEDKAAKPDYMENRFKTIDNFEIGYFISKGEAQWFIKLEKSQKSAFFVGSDHSVLTTAFQNAQAKIEELKAAGK